MDGLVETPSGCSLRRSSGCRFMVQILRAKDTTSANLRMPATGHEIIQ